MIMLAGYDEMYGGLLDLSGRRELVEQMYPLFLRHAGKMLEEAEVVALVTRVVGKFAGWLEPAAVDYRVVLYLGAVIVDDGMYRRVAAAVQQYDTAA